MCPRRSHVLYLLTEAPSGPKDRKILWNDTLEISFKELKCMVSVDTLLSRPYWKLPLAVHTDVSNKQLIDVISHNKNRLTDYKED